MALKRTGTVLGAVLGVVALVIFASFPSHPVFAQSGADTAFSVTNPLGDYTVKPGEKLTHSIVVGLGQGSAAPVDVQVDARGLGQGLDGATLALEPDQDTSPQSARRFMTVDVPTFRLEPGGSKTVTASFTIPESASKPVYYADLYVHTSPTGQQQVGIVRAAHVPIILTLADGEPANKGSISSLDVETVQGGQPITVNSVFKNTGDHHFKMDAVFDLREASGTAIASQPVAFSGSSLLPEFSRTFRGSFSFLNRLQGLPVGDYIAAVKFVGPDGQTLDSKETRFHLSEPYVPFPGIDPAHMKVVTFNDEEPGVVDARAEADTLLRFSNTGKVTGTLVIGKFPAEPKGTPFSVGILDGGLEKDALKFIGIGVQGFSKGNVNVNVVYRDTELGNLDPNTFLVGIRTGLAGHWGPLENLTVQTGPHNVAGDSLVATLNANPYFGLGGDQKTGLASLPMAVLIGAPALLVAAAGTGGFLYARRRSGTANDDEGEADEEDA